METGLRKDAQGKIIPAHFIRNVTVTHSGKTVLPRNGNVGVAQPFPAFPLQGRKPGEKVTIAWLDNQGEKRADEAVIAGG